LADLFHRLGDQVADGPVVVRGDRRDLRDLLLVLRGLGEPLEIRDGGLNSGLDASLETHRVGAGGDVLEPLAEDRLGQHGRGGRAIAGDVGGLGGDLLDHLGAHVLVLVLQLDLLGDGDAVLGDRRAAELLVDDDVTALRAQRGLHRLGHDRDALEQRAPGLLVELQLLRHGSRPPYSRRCTPSSSRMIRYSFSSSLTSEPEYFPKRILSPVFTSRGSFLPSSLTFPLPAAITLPSCGFSFAVSGMMMPPFFTSFSSRRSTRMRSCSGRIFMLTLQLCHQNWHPRPP